jgi:signal transduction histidine kinase
MQHSNKTAQYTSVYIFIAAMVVILFAFILVANSILNRVLTTYDDAISFQKDYLVLKSNLLTFQLSKHPADSQTIDRTFKACLSDFSILSQNPLLIAMRKLSSSQNAERYLDTYWNTASNGMHSFLAGDTLFNRDEWLANSALLENATSERITLIGTFDTNQRKALGILQEVSSIVILVLLAYGFWTASLTHRSENEKGHLHDLLRATFNAQEDERSRIALELHDSIAQDIASSLMIARRLEDNANKDRTTLVSSLKSTLDALRRLSWEMRPPELERLGLRGAMSMLLEDFEKHNKIVVEFRAHSNFIDVLPKGVDLHIYRIIQETLANVSKHSQASVVKIDFQVQKDSFLITIADNGIGFNNEAFEHSGKNDSHLGLAGIRERTRLIGAKLSIETTPSKGTQISVEVPYDK